jgi:hypothetical protein
MYNFPLWPVPNYCVNFLPNVRQSRTSRNITGYISIAILELLKVFIKKFVYKAVKNYVHM